VQLLARLVGVAPERIAQSHQVHETRVRVIAGEADLAAERSDYDGQATTLPDVAVAVRVADCLPIALVAPEAVAVVHAGWRGLADGVIEEGVRTLHALGASEIRAAIGPGAGVCCYEAGDEVHSAFSHLGVHVRHGANADLKAVARTLLEQWGVSEVHDVGICTICADPGLLWSHRREGLDAGRQVGIAWRS
jgi:polyphenol oxidase